MALLGFLSMLILAMAGHSSATYCICKDGIDQSSLQKSLDYACGAGADCSAILQNGACYNPNTVKNHCDYAVNSYYQKKGQAAGACDFSGSATTSTSAPAQSSTCVYQSSPSTTPTTPTTTPPTTTTPPSTTTTPPSTTTTPPSTTTTPPSTTTPTLSPPIGTPPTTTTTTPPTPLFGLGPSGITNTDTGSGAAAPLLKSITASSALLLWVSGLAIPLLG